MQRVLVLGVGNVLMGDDAAGPYVVRTLSSAYDFGPEVTVLDGGTPGLDLTTHLSSCDGLVVVDTVRREGEEGEVVVYRGDEITGGSTPLRVASHDPDLLDALRRLDLEGTAPREVVICGVVPGKVETGLGLSPAVRRAIPDLVDVVVDELRRLGCTLRCRPDPDFPDVWWEGPGRELPGSSGGWSRREEAEA